MTFPTRKTKKNKKQESSFHNSQLPLESTPPKIFQEYPTPLPTAMPRPIGKPWSKTSVHGTFHPVLRLPLRMTKIQLNQYPGKRALPGRLLDICTSRMFMPYGSKRFTKAPSLGQGPAGKRGNQMKFVGTALFMCPTNQKISFVPKYGKLLRPESSLMSEKDGLSSNRKKRSC